MPSLGGTYLPPVVAQVTATQADFQRVLAEVKAQLRALTSTETEVQLGADAKLAEAKLAEFRTIAKRPVTISVSLDTTRALAQLEALRTFASAQTALASRAWAGSSPMMAAGGGGGGGGAAALGAALAPRPPSGGGGGLLSALWPAGMFGAAGFGSIGSLAGFGGEHLLTSGAGILGSMAAGGLGGALLGAGSLTTGAVGMGTDMAGMGQALGDLRSFVTAQNQVNLAMAQYKAAVQQYGAGSQAAATALQSLQAAQANANAVLSQFPVQAQGAIAAAATVAQGFHKQFNSATGDAEAVAANLLAQIMKVGEKFLPAIGAFAYENMNIITNSLQPLFKWVETQGLPIFIAIEHHFTGLLPEAMQAFSQGIEWLIKLLGNLSLRSGGLIGYLAKLFTYLNSSSGWSTTIKYVNKLIGLWKTWWGLIKVAFSDLVDFVKLAAGLGKAVATDLTQMLTALHTYLNSAKGKDAVSSLLKAHLGEIQALIKVAPKVAAAFAKLYMAVGTRLTTAVGFLATVVGKLLKVPFVGNLLAWGAAIGILVAKMKLVKIVKVGLSGLKTFKHAVETIKQVGGTIKSVAGTIKQVGGSVRSAASAFAGWIVQAGKAIFAAVKWAVTSMAKVATVIATNIFGAEATGAAWALAWAAATLGIALLVAAVAVGVVWIVTHWKTVTKFITTAWGNTVNWVKQHWMIALAAVTLGIGLLVAAVIAGGVWIVTHWKTVTKFITTAWGNTVNWVKNAWGDVVNFFGTAAHRVAGFFQTYLIHPIQTAIGWIRNHLQTAFGTLKGVAQTVFGAIAHTIGLAVDVVKKLVHWVGQAIGDVTHLVKSIGKIGGEVVGGIGSVLGNVGKFFGGLATGGPALPGGTYMVGEQGPEVLQMNAVGGGGFVSPLASTGMGGYGGTSVYAPMSLSVSVVVPPGTPSAVASQTANAVGRAVQPMLRRISRNLGAGIYSPGG